MIVTDDTGNAQNWNIASITSNAIFSHFISEEKLKI